MTTLILIVGYVSWFIATFFVSYPKETYQLSLEKKLRIMINLVSIPFVLVTLAALLAS